MAMTPGEVARELPTVMRDLYENHVTRHFKVIAPTVLHVNVNLRCNTRCAMCNIWELKSPHALSPEQFDAIFADPVYAKVEYIILAGGEPTLRHDLPEIVEVMHAHMPRLKKLLIPSNVINRASVQEQYPRIARYCAKHRIRLTLGVSLDGIGETHEKIRGVKGGYAKVMESIEFMKGLQKEVPFNMSIDPTIFSMNIHELQQLKDLAERLNMPITFQIASVAEDYYHNSDVVDVLSVKAGDRNRLAEFLKRQVAESSLLDSLAYYYAEVVEHLEGAPTRGVPCPFADQGLLLNPDGSLQYCHNSHPIGNVLEKSSTELYFGQANLAYRGTVVKDNCPSCRMSCLFFVSLRKEVFPFLSFILKRMVGVHRLHWRKRRRAQPAEPARAGAPG
ncbi:MAG TPA: radical SAM protein [Gemmatimonadales bacterium]|jgi:MoaA/NifB/PqqE/SkfB family radical SAM enzyme|nr:radical SAM protein [Gemmatimonadales bacterium]